MALRPMDRSDSKHLFLWIFRLFYREWAGKGGRFEEELRERRFIHISARLDRFCLAERCLKIKRKIYLKFL